MVVFSVFNIFLQLYLFFGLAVDSY